jgi:amino-acid N-acetyltransferase
MAELAIRVARAADLAAATSLLRAAGLPVEDFSEDLIGNFLVASTGPSVVGCIGPSVVGCIGLEPLSNVGLLRSLAVDPDFRDGGVGRMLVGALEAHASRRGINELWLLTIDADGFFSRLDYRVQGCRNATRRPQPFGGPQSSRSFVPTTRFS